MHHTPFFCCLAAACLLPLPTLAGQPSAPHTHGAARLQVAVDGKTLTLNLESPLQNLLGFEHAPRTDRQKAAVRALAEQLEQAADLFLPSPAARCASVSVKLESPVLQAAKPSQGDGHADLDGEFVFRCENPEALRDLEVTMFKRFPNLQRLDVQVAGARAQSAARLSPQQARITW